MIGEKVRELRLRKKLTQAELAGDFITRNMLSQIENGVATPSVSTVWELAKRLNVPAAYFFTEAGTLDDYRKIGAMEKIKKLYAAKEYERCLAKLRELDVSDDETELLCAWSSLACGIERYRAGYLKSARSYFEEAFSHAKKSLYANPVIAGTAARYLDAIAWIRSEKIPALQTAEQDDIAQRGVLADLAYIRSISGGEAAFVYGADCPPYAEHLEARSDIKSGDFSRAAQKLKGLISHNEEERYAVMKYYALRDLELCSSRAGDYRSAYECSSAGRALADKMNK